MKKILCFGDSNVYGFNPQDFSRYNKEQRWSGILNNKFSVIECGCNNRSIFNNVGELNSLAVISKYLTDDLEYIILQIGINDLQFQYNVDLKIFESKLKELVGLIPKGIKIILLCPSIIDECILKSYFSQLFDRTSIEKSKKILEIYRKISNDFGCIFIDLNKIAKVSKIDGLHYDVENHKKIANFIENLLN